MAIICYCLDSQRPLEGHSLIDDAVRLVDDVAELLRKEETLQRVQLQQVVVVGDLHGQFFDLLRILIPLETG